MRGSILFIISFLTACNLYGQELSAKDFLFASSLPSKKLNGYLSRNKFLPGGSRLQNNTMVNIYRSKPEKNKKKKDTLNIRRTIETFQTKSNSSFTYITSLKEEFTENMKELKEEGFFCGNEKETTGILFQKKNTTVLANMIRENDDDTLYSLVVNQQVMPLPETIQFAEDLLQFYSHEYLISVFGSANV